MGHTPAFPHCGSISVQTGASHKTMPYRCREQECAKRFSVKIGTLMQDSNLGYQVWAIAIYLMLTSQKGVSSMKLHGDLGVTQKSTWHLAHRIRRVFEANTGIFDGPVDVDETFVDGKERFKHRNKPIPNAVASIGKTVVFGIKDRPTNQVRAMVVPNTKRATLVPLIQKHVDPFCRNLLRRRRRLQQALQPRVGSPQRRSVQRQDEKGFSSCLARCATPGSTCGATF